MNRSCPLRCGGWLVVCGMVFVATGCPKEDDDSEGGGDASVADAGVSDAGIADAGAPVLVGPGGGTVSGGGVTLEIPPGALRTPTLISVEGTGESGLPGFLLLGGATRFKPAGLVFSRPVVVTMPAVNLPSGAAVYWSIYHPRGGDRAADQLGFQRVAPTSAGTLRVEVLHFSAGFVADADQTTCPDGQMLCGTDCVALTDSPLHCGGCDEQCVVGDLCEHGVCLTPPPATCGNGVVDDGETCDGDASVVGTCADLGWSGGTLHCSARCQVDTYFCFADCNDGVIQGAEQCDGTNLGGRTCEALGVSPGTLACALDCTFDVSGCGTPGPNCGNGQIDQGEQCDGRESGGTTCESLGFTGGAINCNHDCTNNTTQCRGCGNHVVETGLGEECDRWNLGGYTCQGVGFAGGVLACGADCLFDKSGCNHGCGNSRVDVTGEECDGSDLGGQSCATQHYSSGTLSCTNWCNLDRSDCSGWVVGCGNGVAEGDEECDGADIRQSSCNSPSGHVTCTPQCTISLDTCDWVCGNGRTEREIYEECDRTVPTDTTCQGLGLGGGVMACSSACKLVTTGCDWGCGNGRVNNEVNEQCDGDVPEGATCETNGYPGGGTLACDPDTCRFDNTGCVPFCGNGVVDPLETCDGEDHGGRTCASLGFAGGGALQCVDCLGFDTSGCRGICNNGQKENNEECDGVVPAGVTCEHLGFGGGALACNTECLLDTSGCNQGCGNGRMDSATEECDGNDLGGKGCADFHRAGGELTCTSACQVDTSGCSGALPFCGNHVADDGEECDDDDFRTETCATKGFIPGGWLTCTSGCVIDTTTCLWGCGDGVADGSEDCDGTDLRDETCGTLGFGPGGVLGCAPGCVFDRTACLLGCGNLVTEPQIDEQCDGDVPADTTCQGRGYMAGTLSCDAVTCTIDESSCIPLCGDGRAQLTETCDGNDLRNQTCETRGFAGGGTLRCSPICDAYITTGCIP
jgi:hypothetical protein